MNINFENIIKSSAPLGVKQHEIHKAITMLLEAAESSIDASSVIDEYFKNSFKEKLLYWISGNRKIYSQMIYIRKSLEGFLNNTSILGLFPFGVLRGGNNTDWYLCCIFWLKALLSHLDGNRVESPKVGEYLTTKSNKRIKVSHFHPLMDVLESQMILVTANSGRQYPWGATVELEVFWDEFFTEKMKR